VRSKMLGGRRR